ncbi:MAG: cytochrome c biogenesis protein CcsA [Chloroflexi bacterium]|nr:cytochrome c biogenesis protein CcsA [Chloroflexota bacterium]
MILATAGTVLIGGALLALAGLAVAGAWPGRRDAMERLARRAGEAAVGILGLALALLLLALLRDRFEIAYVAAHSSRALPAWLRVAALWGGQEGSLLLWAFLQALLALLVYRRWRRTGDPLDRWATVILAIVAAGYTAILLFFANPFAPSATVPEDGLGLNPLLRHLGMVVHPPALIAGYVAMAAPYAYAVAGLITRRFGEWTAHARRWTLGAWALLGLGLLLGARWAYDVLGWGGYWGWDPVENAGLLPWLTATGLLHGSAMQDRDGTFRGWNLGLAVSSFLLVIVGTYATRSGVIQSVHAFSRSNLGGPYLAALAIAAAAPAALLAVRWREWRADAGAPRAASWREFTFLLTVVLLVTLTGSILVGSLLPTITEALSGQRLEAGPDWFDRVTGPQFGLLVALLGVCPLLARSARLVRRHGTVALVTAVALPAIMYAGGMRGWLGLLGVAAAGLALGAVAAEYLGDALRRARRRGESVPVALWRLPGSGRRRYGGSLVHLGVILLALGVIGTRGYAREELRTLERGVPQDWGAYRLVYEGPTADRGADAIIQRASIGVYRDAAYVTTLTPEIRLYAAAGGAQVVSQPAVHSAPREDVYLALASVSADGGQATLRLVRNPLASFLWVGGLLLLAGGMVAVWPDARAAHAVAQDRPRRRTAHAAAGAGTLALVGVVLVLWARPLEALAGGGRPALGRPAPEVRLTLLDGTRASLADYAGRVVVLHFGATWCTTCADEYPDLARAHAEQGEDGAAFLGVYYDDSPEAVEREARERAIPYPVGPDASGNPTARAYGVRAVPETFVIDPAGALSYVHVGPISAEWLADEVAWAAGRGGGR